MNVIHQAKELGPEDRTVSIAIGMFDGVHLGHQRVLRQTIRDAEKIGAMSVAISFDQHPNAVVAPQRMPPLIYSLAQRLRVLGSMGIETVLLLHFDRAFSEQPAEAFVTGLIRDIGCVHSVCIGRNFTFGHKRSGNVALLKSMGQQLGFAVHEMPAVLCHRKIVSSTRIREAIQQGDLPLASEMLGRPYSIAGRVGRGEQLGRRLGFPTANLEIAGLVLPPSGVYAGAAQVMGRIHKAVANVGYRPTVHPSQPALRVEVHLLDFGGDLYEQELEFTFRQKLRGEEKFASLTALQAQIKKDVRAVQTLWK